MSSTIKNHSLKSLVEALIAGEAIQIANTDQQLQLSVNGRIALNFYQKNPIYWSASHQVNEKETRLLLAAFDKPKLPDASSEALASTEIKKWHLKKIRAHRFAGLHRHCNSQDGSPPPDFEWIIGADLSLIWGFNGAGKSSLLSAITWCLTNRALRSYGAPNEVHEFMEVREDTTDGHEQSDDEQDGELSIFSLPPIVPIPTADELKILNDQPVSNDTWVELIFESEDGTKATVRRELKLNNHGNPKVEVFGLQDLALTDIALQVGTVMPAIAAHMRFDQPTELGQAIAELTGLKPLAELGKRSPRIIKRLKEKEVGEAKEKQAQAIEEFQKLHKEYLDKVVENPALSPSETIVVPGNENCALTIANAKNVVEQVSKDALKEFEEILGLHPSLEDAQKVESFLSLIEQANGLLSSAEIKTLHTVENYLAPIKILSESEEELYATEKAMAAILAEAEEFAEKLREEEKAKRWQLYARIAQWHETHHPGRPFEHCPACSSNLNEVPKDAVIDQSVRDALESCRKAASYLLKTADEWVTDKITFFKDGLPLRVRNLIEHEWQTDILSLYNKAIFQELLIKPGFKKTFAPLIVNAENNWKKMAAALPLWEKSAPIKLSINSTQKDRLEKALNSAASIVSLARFRRENKDQFDNIFLLIIGKQLPLSNKVTKNPQSVSRELPLANQLALLYQATILVRPIAKTFDLLKKLKDQFDAWEKQRDHIKLLNDVADALKPFTRFPQLVEHQVAGLLNDLGATTGTWSSHIYKPHYLSGPMFKAIEADQKTGLDLRVSFGGNISVSAHQVMNASALRAYIWSFLLALWEKIRKERSFLDLMLLDDPQMLFDAINRENFSSAVPKMLAIGLKPIVASNDVTFCASVLHYMTYSGHASNMAFLEISPISQIKLSASIFPKIEEIYKCREEWKQEENNTQKAQNYVALVRIYIEEKLWNLLACDLIPLHKPDYSTLIGCIESARKTGQRPFDEPPFEKLINSSVIKRDVSPTSFYAIINKAHHKLADITPVEAKFVDQNLNAARALIDAAVFCYARFMGRITAEERDQLSAEIPPEPVCQILTTMPLNVLPAMAARMNFTSLLKQDEKREVWSPSELGDIALFGVGAATLGLICLTGQTAIVDPAADVKNGDYAIVHHKGKFFARRIAIDRHRPSELILESVPAASGNLPPTYIAQKSISRAMKIVGVLFDDHKGISGEATQVSTSEVLSKINFVAPVKDESAFPIVPQGSYVLLSSVSASSADELEKLTGRLVAVITSDGSASAEDGACYLKRLGNSVAGFPAVRTLDNIGLIGSSLQVHFDSLGKSFSSDIPKVHQIWRVCGVLYPSTVSLAANENLEKMSVQKHVEK